jgi:signal transduction histidine kinase
MSSDSNAREQQVRRWWRYIGPWPLRPWLAGFVVGGLALASNSAYVPADIVRNLLVVVPAALVSGIATAVGVGGTLLLVSRTLHGREVRALGTYLFIIVMAAVVGSTLSIAAELAAGLASIEQMGLLPVRAFRMTLWILVVLALAGVTADRLSRQTNIAQRSLQELREQQSLMLIHEEQSRRQFAMLLHDQVQAGLMTACLELKVVTSDETAVNRERIEAAITRIDRIRGLELHRAARALSPDLSNLGLHGVLRDLMRIYEPAMEASIDVAPEIAKASPLIPTQVLLACYRIVEQGVLNSVVHGQASECVITVALPSEATVSIEVRDNGTGVAQSDNARGFGSAVLDSWCRELAGSWALDYPPGGGARLMATLSLESAGDFNLTGANVSLQ